MEYVISCETFVRLSNVLNSPPLEPDPILNTIRIENGIAMATNRRFMAVERIGQTPPEPINVILNPLLIEQCRKEMVYHSKLHIVANPMLKFASAKTTLGYIHQGNACHFENVPHIVDTWKTRIPKERPKKSNGYMYWDAESLLQLVNSSPSKCVSFEPHIDMNNVTIIRDVNNPDWFGAFIPKESSLNYTWATLPEWFK